MGTRSKAVAGENIFLEGEPEHTSCYQQESAFLLPIDLYDIFSFVRSSYGKHVAFVERAIGN